MPEFSKKSKGILSTCDGKLVQVMEMAILVVDFSVLCGLRGEEEQNYLYRMGFSKVPYPNSRHNAIPPKKSEAIDIAPYPLDWSDTEKFYYVAGVVMGIAGFLGVKLRWGGDWDMDQDLHDQSFMDLGHFELVEV